MPQKHYRESTDGAPSNDINVPVLIYKICIILLNIWRPVKKKYLHILKILETYMYIFKFKDKGKSIVRVIAASKSMKFGEKNYLMNMDILWNSCVQTIFTRILLDFQHFGHLALLGLLSLSKFFWFSRSHSLFKFNFHWEVISEWTVLTFGSLVLFKLNLPLIQYCSSLHHHSFWKIVLHDEV